MKRKEDQGEIELYYFDEASFSLVSNVPYAWQRKGETIEIPTSKSKNINVLGFMKRDNTFMPYVIEGAIDSAAVITIFNSFIESKRDKNIGTVIVIDNAPVHTSNAFEARKKLWKKDHNVNIFCLSKYSPELNLIEILWKSIKDRWLPFSAYSSFKSLSKELNKVLKNIGDEHTISFA